MFERLSNAARMAMEAANARVHEHQRDFMEPEHILLGLLDDEGSMAARLLRHLGRDPAQIAAEIARAMSADLGPAYDPQAGSSRRLPQTPSSKRVIEYAIEEARDIGDRYVGTQHLLLALLRDPVFALHHPGMLHALGVTHEAIRVELDLMMRKKRFEDEA